MNKFKDIEGNNEYIKATIQDLIDDKYFRLEINTNDNTAKMSMNVVKWLEDNHDVIREELKSINLGNIKFYIHVGENTIVFNGKDNTYKQLTIESIQKSKEYMNCKSKDVVNGECLIYMTKQYRHSLIEKDYRLNKVERKVQEYLDEWFLA